MADYIDKIEVGAKIQMMYIRREMDYGGENDFCRGMRKALRVIKNMPASDVQPVKHGRWICNEELYYNCMTKCSCCNEEYYTEDIQNLQGDLRTVNFCPNCGAKMDLNE